MELIRRFSTEQYAGALDAWGFLGVAGKTPSFSSAFGDVFLETPDGWWFLDILGGTLTREWDSSADLQAALNTSEGQDRFLMAGLVEAANGRGLAPGMTEILAFTLPPMLGGDISPANLEVSDMVVTVDLHGQIHEQIRDLPPGTPITGFTLE